MSDDYAGFLERATAVLATEGAQPIALPDSSTAGWTSDWDQLLLSAVPGSTTLYAFGEAPADRSEFRTRLDRLATRVASTNLMQGPPVRLVAVAVFPLGVAPALRRALSGLTPSTFYQGLKPTTWVVDLREQRIFSSGLGRQADRELLSTALSSNGSAPLDVASLEEMRRRQAQSQNAFYSMVQGRKPVGTYALVAINVLIFLWVSSQGAITDQSLTNVGAMVPVLVQHGQWWRLGSAMFLHASWTHLIFNMVSLVVIGTLTERLYGTPKFLAIYLLSGLTGSFFSLGHALMTGSTAVPSVGASGAIFGVAGALVTVRFQSSEVIPARLRQQITTGVLPLVLLNLAIGILTPYIDNSAHVGGLIGGIVLSLVLRLPTGAAESHEIEAARGRR